MFPFTTVLLLSLSICSTLASPILRRQNVPASVQTNFADPTFIRVDNTYYAFATSGNGKNIQVASTENEFSFAVEWTVLGMDALPNAPAWADVSSKDAGPGAVWAPYIHQLPSGSFVLYFTAPSAQDTTKHCIGAATSDSITGPYVPTSDQPLICPLDQGGAIDPALYADPTTNNLFLLYKVDGNSLTSNSQNGAPTPIMLQQVSSKDGVTFIDAPFTILDHTEGEVLVEAPAMFYHTPSNTHFLLFSSGTFTTSEYNIGYASSTSGIGGPYTRGGHVLKSGDFTLDAPGSCDVDVGIDSDDGQIVFHASVNIGQPSEGSSDGDWNKLVRWMYTGKVVVQDGVVKVTELY